MKAHERAGYGFQTGPAEQEFGELPAILDACLLQDSVCQADQQEGSVAR